MTKKHLLKSLNNGQQKALLPAQHEHKKFRDIYNYKKRFFYSFNKIYNCEMTTQTTSILLQASKTNSKLHQI